MKKDYITHGVIAALVILVIGGYWLATDNRKDIEVASVKQENNQVETFGAEARIFTSAQLGTGATADYILSTNGATSTWIENSGGGGSTLHVDGGGFVYPQTGDYSSAPYYVATSTTATSSFVDISASGRIFLNSEGFSDLTGTGLLNTGSVLTLDPP